MKLFSYRHFYLRFILVENIISCIPETARVVLKRNKKEVKCQLSMHTGDLKNYR